MSKPNSELKLNDDPIMAFESWLKDAVVANCAEPTAMTLATATKSGVPSARIVLFKGFKNDGFKFYTNYQSPKSLDLNENPIAALVFLWTSSEFQRQVRIFGGVQKLSKEESAEYFQSRARGSQIGAWSSPQSQKVKDRNELEKLVSNTEKKFGDGQPLSLPAFWGGYILQPQTLEFWEGREFRIHERFIYEKNGSTWVKNRLAP